MDSHKEKIEKLYVVAYQVNVTKWRVNDGREGSFIDTDINDLHGVLVETLGTDNFTLEII